MRFVARLTSLLTGDLLPRDLSFRPLLGKLLLLLLLLHDGLLPLLLLPLLLLSLHLGLRDPTKRSELFVRRIFIANFTADRGELC